MKFFILFKPYCYEVQICFSTIRRYYAMLSHMILYMSNKFAKLKVNLRENLIKIFRQKRVVGDQIISYTCVTLSPSELTYIVLIYIYIRYRYYPTYNTIYFV